MQNSGSKIHLSTGLNFLKGKSQMYRVKKQSGGLGLFMIGALLIGAMLLGCAQTPVIGAPVDHARLKDGTYEGSYRGGPNKASVQVIIKDNNIVNIEILQHQAWRGKKAETAIVERIIAHQSTKVDAVSGATNSSRVIMNAVQNAIEKAYPN
jgi:uncharacterized protein with FMN-binding domain